MSDSVKPSKITPAACNDNIIASARASFVPDLLTCSPAEIIKKRTELEELIANPSPDTGQIEREAELSVYLIDDQVAQIQKWANEVNPDTILMGEDHLIANHQLALARLTIERQENLGLEMPKNAFSKVFEFWAYKNYKEHIRPKAYVELESKLQTKLTRQAFLIDTRWSPYAPESAALSHYLIQKEDLKFAFNDAPSNACAKLIINEKQTSIETQSQKGMYLRNKEMVDKNTALQQCGSHHIGGGEYSPYKESMASLWKNQGKATIAIYQAEHIFWHRTPIEAKANPNIRHMPLPGRAFRGQNNPLEHTFLRATMKAWGYNDNVFEGFLEEREKAQATVENVFEETLDKYRQEHHPIQYAIRNMVKGF